MTKPKAHAHQEAGRRNRWIAMVQAFGEGDDATVRRKHQHAEELIQWRETLWGKFAALLPASRKKAMKGASLPLPELLAERLEQLAREEQARALNAASPAVAKPARRRRL